MAYMRLALLLLALPMAAQTRLTVDQLKGPAGEIRLLALDSTGKLITLTLGESLAVLDGALRTLAPILTPGWTAQRVESPLARNADGTYTGTGATVYRNGLMMTAGRDYDIIGDKITPKEPWAASDIVTGVRFTVVPVQLSQRAP
jgi:hypothetical protein